MTELQKQIATDLLSIRAVYFRPEQPFTWASGIKSPVYCDNRLTLTAPARASTASSTLPPVEIRSSTTTTFAPLSSLPSMRFCIP